MRLLLVSHSPRFSGAERSLLTLAKGLDELMEYVHVVVPETGVLQRKLTEAEIEYSIVPLPWWAETRERVSLPGAASVARLERVIKKHRIDAVLTNTSVVPWGALAAMNQKVPHAWFIRELHEETHAMPYVLDYAEILEIIDGLSAVVLANSHTVKRSVESKINADKISVAYSSIDVKSPATEDAEFTFKDADLKLAIVGRVTPSKGLEDAITAAGELKESGVDISLVFAGPKDEAYVRELKALARKKGVEEAISFLGYIDNPYPLMKQADAIVTCSRNEAMGRVTIEGMLLQKLVIGARAGATPEFITHQETGLLYEAGNGVDLAEKIEWHRNNLDQAATIAANAQRYAERTFTKEAFINTVRDSLISAVNSGNYAASVPPEMMRLLLRDFDAAFSPRRLVIKKAARALKGLDLRKIMNHLRS